MQVEVFDLTGGVDQNITIHFRLLPSAVVTDPLASVLYLNFQEMFDDFENSPLYGPIDFHDKYAIVEGTLWSDFSGMHQGRVYTPSCCCVCV